MLSASAIGLAVGGAVVGWFIGGPPLAVALAVLGWGVRVAAAIPRNPAPVRIDPFTLGEPWKRLVQDAVQAQSRFREALSGAASGPLRDRMEEIGEKLAAGVEQAWRVGRSGQALMEARRRIDAVGVERELTRAKEQAGEVGEASEVGGVGAARELGAGSPKDPMLESLEAQLASARRLDATISSARDQLRLTTARLDEAVARAAELSVRAGDVHALDGLGDDVDTLVTDLEALRLGLEELDRPRPASGNT